jgi:hypothetical protein
MVRLMTSLPRGCRRLVRFIAATVVASASLGAPTVGGAADEGSPLDDRAREAVASCEEELKNPFSNRFDLGVCLGVLKGLHYLSADVCVPPGLSLIDMASVMTRYFVAHPGDAHSDFRERSLEALRAAWPCKGRRGI